MGGSIKPLVQTERTGRKNTDGHDRRDARGQFVV